MTRFFLLLSAAVVTVVGSASGRTFTSTEGKTLEAEVVRATETTVTLRLKNKRTSTIPLTRLSEGDRDYVKTWLAEQVPRLRFKPNMVRSNKDERYGLSTTYKTSRQIQSRSLTVDITNDENTKGLEESTMKYILIGRSISERKKYKIMAIQTAEFTVPAGGKTAVPFKKVVNTYYDSQYSRSGYKIVGYVLFAERKNDQREVYTYASMSQFKDAIYSIVDLPSGSITDDTFQKKEVTRIGGGVPGIGEGIRPRRERNPDDVIVIE